MHEPSPKVPARYLELAAKWQSGTLTPEESQELESWYASGQDLPVLVPASVALTDAEHAQATLDHIREKAGLQTPAITHTAKRRTLRMAIAAAASLLLMGGGAFWLLNNRATPAPTMVQGTQDDVAPGHNGALLHLANGSIVALDNAKNGTVAVQGGLKAIKQGGSIQYEGQTNQVIYNTVTTDRGQQWQVVLSDGTKVWLNAASGIRYPAAFTGAIREVELTGEAYFEVAHDATHPFHVRSGNVDVRVLGTHFNVNAYNDEGVIRTTLLEGSVAVKKDKDSVKITPGYQAIVQPAAGRINVVTANTGQVTAWKDGIFNFDKLELEDIMRQISRWYDISVVYEGEMPKLRFRGEIGRDLNLSQVLKALEQTHVHFVVKDKVITVLSK